MLSTEKLTAGQGVLDRTSIPPRTRSTALGLSQVIVRLRQPKREITVAGADPPSNALLDSLELNRESFLIIRNGTLVPGDARLDDADTDRNPPRGLGWLDGRAVARGV